MKSNQLVAPPGFEKFVRPTAQILTLQLSDDGAIPNSRLPLILYQQALALTGADPAGILERLFAANAWRGSWRNGVYGYHHYHSTSHEVLGVYSGSATVQFGGASGITQEVGMGDVVVIPAGVAHKNLGATPDFAVVGAYPAGQHWDMCYGKDGERPRADEQIAKVPLPKTDPICGPDGPLLRHWK